MSEILNNLVKLTASTTLVLGFLVSPTMATEQNAARLAVPQISETLTIPRHSVEVLGNSISYLQTGEGDPVLFIHGNPTSAYLWRNIMPYVAGNHRAIAIDLIGMGSSDKPDIEYTFADHYRYLDGFVKALDLKNITLVAHDWGAALAWNYARQNPDKVVRLAFMEGVLPPAFPRPSFESMGEEMGNMFRAFKDQQQGHKMIIEGNMFVEQVLPEFVNRPLGHEARAVYGAPYLTEKNRKPTLAWPREVPIAGEPAANVNALAQISSFMSETRMPVLLAYASPGVLVSPQAVDWYVGKISNLETAFVGQGLHFIQEDQPDGIGRALKDWMRRN